MVMYSHSRLSTFEQCPKKFEFKYIDKIKTIGKSIEALLGFAIHSVLELLYNEVKTGRMPTVEEIITIYSDIWKENHDENILIVRNDLNESDYFNKGIEFLTNYYTKNYPFDDNTLETEKKIFLKLDEKGEYQMIGFIDRLVYNLKEKRYEVHDYKTASTIPKQENIDKDRQLALYSIAIKNIFGQDKEVVLIWHYLAHLYSEISAEDSLSSPLTLAR